MAMSLEFYKEKNFKKVEVGGVIFEIPKDWEISELGNVLELLRNGLTAKQNKTGEGFPTSRIETISSGKIDPNKVGYITNVSTDELMNYRLKDGDILFSHINSLEHIGKTAIYEGTPELLLHGMNLLLLRPNKLRVNSYYLLNLIRHYRTQKIFRNISKKAVNQASINQRQLSKIKVFLADLEEQRKIAHVLTTIDKAIEEVDKAIKKAERIKKGLMQELLTKGIGHKEFKDTEIGRIPKEWEVVKLGDILILKNGERPKLSEKGSFFVYGANGIMGLSNNYIVDSDYTIIIGRVGASGEVHLGGGKIWVSDNAIYSESYNKSNTYLPFIFYLLKFKNLKSFAIKTTHPIITQSFLKSFKIPLPPLEEQKKIAEILSKWDRVIELKKAKREKLERMKKKVMELLLTGKVRVK